MSARVITFRSALLPAKDDVCINFATLSPRRTRQMTSASDKVLPMFSLAHDLSSPHTVASTDSMLATVQAEWADRYVEVEIEGLTLKRLGCIYVAAVQQTKLRMLQGVRSFFHLNPAH